MLQNASGGGGVGQQPICCVVFQKCVRKPKTLMSTVQQPTRCAAAQTRSSPFSLEALLELGMRFLLSSVLQYRILAACLSLQPGLSQWCVCPYLRCHLCNARGHVTASLQTRCRYIAVSERWRVSSCYPCSPLMKTCYKQTCTCCNQTCWSWSTLAAMLKNKSEA